MATQYDGGNNRREGRKGVVSEKWALPFLEAVAVASLPIFRPINAASWVFRELGSGDQNRRVERSNASTSTDFEKILPRIIFTFDCHHIRWLAA